MQSRILGRALGAALSGLLVAGGLQAQEAAPPVPARQGQAGPQMPDSVQEMMQEFQELQQRLGELQQQALDQSEELRAERQAVEASIQDAMAEEVPELERKMDRMDSLQGELQEARQAEDQEQLMSLSMEANQLSQELQQAQRAAMQTEAVADELEAFRENLVQQMTAIDAEAEDLIARLEELAAIFRAIQEEHQSPG